MRRMLFILALLWLGFVTSIGLAWFVSTTPIQHERHLLSSGSERISEWQNDWRIRGWFTPARYAYLAEPNGAEFSSDTEPFAIPGWSVTNQPANEDDVLTGEHAAGWPWKCLRSRWFDFGFDMRLRLIEDHIEGAWPAYELAPRWLAGEPPDYSGMFVSFNHEMMNLGEQYSISYTPIWPGLIGNTFVFAALWLPVLALITLFPTLRRVWRRRHHRCIRCRYSLHGIESEVCPECGWSIRRGYPLLTTGRICTTCVIAGAMTGATVAFAHNRILRTEDIAPLHHAARYNDVERIDSLIDKGAPVDQPMPLIEHWAGDGYQRTPLILAAEYGHEQSVAALLAHGADPDACANCDLTVLMRAAYFGQPGVVEQLIDAGADVSATTELFGSALSSASESCCIECMHLLLDAGAELHVRDPDYADPLICAARVGCENGVRLLLEREKDQIDRELVDRAYEAAVEGGHDAIQHILGGIRGRLENDTERASNDSVDS